MEDSLPFSVPESVPIFKMEKNKFQILKQNFVPKTKGKKARVVVQEVRGGKLNKLLDLIN